jgi:hypothetical protein
MTGVAVAMKTTKSYAADMMAVQTWQSTSKPVCGSEVSMD